MEGAAARPPFLNRSFQSSVSDDRMYLPVAHQPFRVCGASPRLPAHHTTHLIRNIKSDFASMNNNADTVRRGFGIMAEDSRKPARCGNYGNLLHSRGQTDSDRQERKILFSSVAQNTWPASQVPLQRQRVQRSHFEYGFLSLFVRVAYIKETVNALLALIRASPLIGSVMCSLLGSLGSESCARCQGCWSG